MRFEEKISWYSLFVSDEEMELKTRMNKPVSMKVNGRNVCLVRFANNKLYAIKDKCPHQGVKLSAGFCKNNDTIVCSWHQFEFDLATGRGVSGTGMNVDSYKVRRDESGVWEIGFEKTVLKLW